MGGAGGGSGTAAVEMGTLGSGIRTIGSGGSALGTSVKIIEKSRWFLVGGFGVRIAEKSNGALDDICTLRYYTAGDSLRERCCGVVCLGLG